MRPHVKQGVLGMGYAGKLAQWLRYIISLSFLILLFLFLFPGRSNAQSDDQLYQDSTRTPRQPIGRVPDDAIVTRGSFDRSISLPGSAGAFRIGGNVIANANYDFDNLGFQQISFQPTIPLNGTSEDGEDQFAAHVRLSRLNVDYRSPTKLGEFRAFIEFDFFGAGGEFVNDYTLRLRHAVAELGNWKFGQFWSGFMDVFSQPETADPGGPIGLPSKRNPGIYYVHGEQTKTSFGLGIENPTADLVGRVELQRSENLPSFVGFIKIKHGLGYLRLAGMTIQQRSMMDDLVTGAVHLSGRLNLPFIHKQDNLAFGIQYGEGFTHYYSSFVVGLDGIIRDDGSIEATQVLGGFIAYQRWWTKTLRSTFNASFFDFDLPDGFEDTTYQMGYRLGMNLVWSPIFDATFGLELNYETFETFGGLEADGLRLEFVSRFDF